MAEEEETFTFVDKRRTQAAAATPVVNAPEPLEAAAPAPEDFEMESDGDLETGPAPTTYDLIGYCINLLASQAWQKLGLLADPQTGEAKPDLAEAKLAIDTVSDLAARLETAPAAMIPEEMRRELRTLLNDLRLNYVSLRGPSL